MSEFLTDIQTLRERARAKIEEGPITDAYTADRERVIDILNESLATEIVCWLRYKRHYFTAQGINAQTVAAEFLQHANEEAGHAGPSCGASPTSIRTVSRPAATPSTSRATASRT